MDPLLLVLLGIAMLYGLVQIALPLAVIIIAVLLRITNIIRRGLIYLLLLIQKERVMRRVHQIVKERKH